MGKKLSKKSQKNRSKKTQRNMKKVKLTKKQKRRTNKHYKKRRTNRKKVGVKRGGMNGAAAEQGKHNAEVRRRGANGITAQTVNGPGTFPGTRYHFLNIGNTPNHMVMFQQLYDILGNARIKEKLILVARHVRKINNVEYSNERVKDIKTKTIIDYIVDKKVVPILQLATHLQSHATKQVRVNGEHYDHEHALQDQARDALKEFKKDILQYAVPDILKNIFSFGLKSCHTFRTLILTYFAKPTIRAISLNLKNRNITLNPTDEAIIFGDIYAIILNNYTDKMKSITDVDINGQDLFAIFKNNFIITIQEVSGDGLRGRFFNLQDGSLASIIMEQGYDDEHISNLFANIMMEMYRICKVEIVTNNAKKQIVPIVEKIQSLKNTVMNVLDKSASDPVSEIRKGFDLMKYTTHKLMDGAIDLFDSISTSSNTSELMDKLRKNIGPVVGGDSIKTVVKLSLDSASKVYDTIDGVYSNISNMRDENQMLKSYDQLIQNAYNRNLYANYQILLLSLESLTYHNNTDDDLLGQIDRIRTWLEQLLTLSKEQEKAVTKAEINLGDKVKKIYASQPPDAYNFFHLDDNSNDPETENGSTTLTDEQRTILASIKISPVKPIPGQALVIKDGVISFDNSHLPSPGMKRRSNNVDLDDLDDSVKRHLLNYLEHNMVEHMDGNSSFLERLVVAQQAAIEREKDFQADLDELAEE